MKNTKQKPEKLNLQSMSITEEQKRKLRQLFPEVFNEKKIDWERLKAALGEDLDKGPERYHISWPGKADCFRIIQKPSAGTLKPCKKESLDWDKTQNLFIEGDNLEVLKLLQQSYYGKIKMIYIDPPYNTGKDFIYPDKYSETLETYLQYTEQKDAEGKRFSTNQETDGRFHSKWINMMYPRLFLARNLLRDDGVIFISIDDNEISNLRKICDEIFGEENFVESFIWRSRQGKGSTSVETATIHEYIFCYAKNKNEIQFHFDIRVKKNREKERLRQWGQGDKREDRPSMFFPIKSEEYGDIYPIKPDGSDGRWRSSKNTVQQMLKENLITFEKQQDGRIEVYRIIPEGSKTKTAYDSIFDSSIVKTTAHGSKELNTLFNERVFSYPKPTTLIKHLAKIVGDLKDSIILDFFAGSATTAHAVYEKNLEDEGDRKYICVQLPEPTQENTEQYKAGYKTIADIGKERIRRSVQKIKEENKQQSLLDQNKNNLDLGFRVFKLDKSNFKIWDEEISKDKTASEQIEMHLEDFVNPKSSDEDLLYEILIKTGYPLTTEIKILKILDKTIYSIENDALLICLEKRITKELIKEIAKLKPARVVCLDMGFANNDQLKTNAFETFKSHGVRDFKTI